MKGAATLTIIAAAAFANGGLVAHWTGQSERDALGRNDAVLLSGARINSSAFEFPGNLEAVAFVPDNGSLALTQNISISCWVYPREYAHEQATSAQSQILFRGDDRNGLDPFDLLLLKSGHWQFKIWSENDVCAIQAPAALFEWTHLLAVLDAQLGIMRLYVNGELLAQSFTPIRPFKTLDAGCSPGISIGNVQFPSGKRHMQPFNGFIRDVRLYDSVLKPADLLPKQ